MKKLKTKLIAFAFLTFASLSAYAYLSLVSATQPDNKSLYSVGQDTPEEQELYLPDVEAVNKLLEAGEKLKAFGR
ncbi:MAG: hypothetical protein AB8G86_30630 [Saprospiraceae bacterium]